MSSRGDSGVMFRLAACALVGALVVAALVAAIGSAAPSLRPAAAPIDCTLGQPLGRGKECEWVASPRRFAYCKYEYDDSDPENDRHGLFCVSPVSGNWVRITCCDENRASYGRSRRFLGFQRQAEVVRGEWYSDRPGDAVAQCRASDRFFFCHMTYRTAMWFKPDGSFALLRRTEGGRWKLEARG